MGLYRHDGSWIPTGLVERSRFKMLSPDEVLQFREYALENDPPKGTPLSVLHPVCVDVWKKRGVM
jgi:hypothetical protein